MKYIPCYLKLRLEDNCAIVMTKEYQLFLLNRMGYEILISIKKIQDLSDVINYLSGLFDVDFKRLERDVNNYINYMIDNKIIAREE